MVRAGLNEKAEDEVTKWTKREGNNGGLPDEHSSGTLATAEVPMSESIT